MRFAENGIDLELGFWIGDPENGQLELKSTINREILGAFNRNGIRIPFPQRELRFQNGQAGLGGGAPKAPARGPESAA